ncbi:MAG: FAD-binding protein [Streptosporangiales bacterium]|nr:FAD-binding protein [Streptosporangiales bacterium]
MFDVIVVGGGPAGLSAALMLGRALRTTLVLDSGEYRNAPAAAMHNFLTRDGTPPRELRRLAREELAVYPTLEVRDLAVVGVEAAEGGFRVTLSDGTAQWASRLLLATGLADDLPPVEGLAELWGRGVFHCPNCHGFEVRDVPIAVLGSGYRYAELALHLTRFGSDVALCGNGPADLGADMVHLLADHGVAVREEPIARLVARDGELEGIEFVGGPPLARRAIFTGSRLRQRSPLPAQLGCAGFDDGTIEVDDFGRSSVPGVYAAVIAAAASGTIAGGLVDKELLSADLGLPSPLSAAGS